MLKMRCGKICKTDGVFVTIYINTGETVLQVLHSKSGLPKDFIKFKISIIQTDDFEELKHNAALRGSFFFTQIATPKNFCKSRWTQLT